MNRRQKIIVSVTGIFLVLLLLVGLTYAYFLTRITGNTNDKSISVSTANLAIVYGGDDGSVIGEGEKITPGTTFEPKTFTVTNQGNANTDYVVVIEEANVTYAETIEVDGVTQTAGTETTFESNDFTYTLTCESGCNSVQEPTTIPIEGGILVGNRLDVGETQTYSFTLTYNETSKNQTNDMNKKLEAKINIKDITTINPYSDKPNTLAYNIINNAVALTNEEKSLGYAELVGAPYSKIGSEVSEIKTFPKGYEIPEEKEMSVKIEQQEYYWTYATEYNINPETGKFSLVNPKTCKYNETNCISDLVIEGKEVYLTSPTALKNSSEVNEIKDYEDLYYLYRVTNSPIDLSNTVKLSYKRIIRKPESILSTTQDEYGTSYYYRGAVKNNYLEFNNMCWRIVRIEGDGAIKLTLAAQKKCSEITNEDISSSYIGIGDYGYTMDSNDKYFADYENSANSEKSMEYLFDKWLYEKFDEETIDMLKKERVCVGDTLTKYDEFEKIISDATARELGYWYYANALRIYNKQKYTLICEETSKTITEKTIYPLTVDEVIFAGGMPENDNYTFYLRENAKTNYWWTSSLMYFDGDFERVFYIDYDGYIYDNNIDDDTVSLRPSISLMPGRIIQSGDGSIINPYVIDTSK